MSIWKLVKRSLLFYWRTNVGVLLSVLVSTAVLAGALVVGDSVSYSLDNLVTERLGKTELALVSGDRFFRKELADELAPNTAAVLQVRGMISNSDGTQRANQIAVLGIDESFYKLAIKPGKVENEGVTLNTALAKRLGVNVGQEVVLRIEKSAAMSREVPLVPDKDLSVAFRLTVTAIAGSEQFGNFNLAANQIAPLNAFVPINWLGEKLDRTARANMILTAGDDQTSASQANEMLANIWQLADAELEPQKVADSNMIELRSKRIFIDESISTAALAASANATGVLSYFVNELRADNKTTPYSMVTAIDKRLIDDQMRDDQIVINQWLADDLNVKAGDNIELKYFVLGPMRKLAEKSATFTIRKILPMEALAADSQFMPDFPGLSDANNCRDWEPGIPIDLDKIRDKDEDYWDQWKGAPKAFVTLAAGQKMWANRYGNLTAVRYPANVVTKEQVEAKILAAVDPAYLGLYFEPVRQRGLKASAEATDFGGLFLGFSIFLIISGLALTALVFVFGVESRSGQMGTLLALGFKPGVVKRLLLTEGAAIAIAGSICGTAMGLFYTKAMIYALATIWKTAVSGTVIQLYANPATLAGSAIAGIVVSVLAIRLTLRKAVSRSARELLTSELQWQFFGVGKKSGHRAAFTLAALAAAAAVAILVIAGAGDSQAMATSFFGSGALLLIASLALGQALLKMAGGKYDKPLISLSGLALRNATRRAGRSLTVIALLACGVFLVIAVGANRHDASAEARHRDSGTGGFALYGESAIGILHDLNTADGRKSLRLEEDELEDVDVVQIRLREGDDASCLNLNRAQKPRLLGVSPERLKQRGAFGFAQKIKDAQKEDTWELLNRDYGKDVVPAIGDKQMIVWLLGKKIGDELEYIDQRGQKFRILLVAGLKNSILQGSLVISERQFIKRFPSEAGYRAFLIDAPQDHSERAANQLSVGLIDFGLDLTDTTKRLAAFNAIEHTYLSIFQLLGGLGMMLGSIGLGLVVLRNMLDRRGELAMLRALGFNMRSIKQMVVYEHSGLMLFGLASGVVAALVAVAPVLMSPGPQVPFVSLAITIAAIAASGLIWIWLATTFAGSGQMLDALRNE